MGPVVTGKICLVSGLQDNNKCQLTCYHLTLWSGVHDIIYYIKICQISMSVIVMYFSFCPEGYHQANKCSGAEPCNADMVCIVLLRRHKINL